MYNPNSRPNLDLGAIMQQASTPGRRRVPTPIRKLPLKIAIPNKQNIGNVSNAFASNMVNAGYNKQWSDRNDQGISLHNTDDLVCTKKPLISPVRNPFKIQIENKYGLPNNRNISVPGKTGPVYSTNQPGPVYSTNQHQQKPKLAYKPEQNEQQPQENYEAQACANHPNKSAEFKIEIQDELFSYCGRCAAQLASQGFQVCKIEPTTVKKNGPFNAPRPLSKRKARELPRYPEYQGNYMYEQILIFLSGLSQVESEHESNMARLQKIEPNYIEQIELTTNFYSELLSFVEQMRDDHLADLEQSNRNHSQIADIEYDYLRQNMDEIGNIRSDIEQNLQTIVEKLDEEDLKNNLNYYRQKIQVYSHKVEEQAQFFEKVITFQASEYEKKLGRVQDFLMEVWNSSSEFNPSGVDENEEAEQEDPMASVNAQHPIKHNGFVQQPRNIGRNPKNPQSDSHGESQPAFRRLFEEEDQLIAETSPQFKKI